MFDDITGRLLLVVLLLAAASLWFGLRRRGDGRFRAADTAPVADTTATATRSAARLLLSGADLGTALGERATFVQFSTTTCATCPQVSRTLGDVAREAAGVAHVEVAAEERLDLVRRFGISRTPTVLLVGPRGEVWSRAAGPMHAPQALAALRQHLGSVTHA